MKTKQSDERVKLLSELETGGRFKIIKINARGEIRRRLLDIGFIKNQEGKIIREALLRDPIELEIKGTMVSLRRSEARLINVVEQD
ncbi:MAG: ferrous iron transport protein A [Candidatus Marinimicrobia bacterium]|nr:ferrous iron transport protein A [bacterium]MCG2716446.1 ferrous iron transport protein A [Candidatus Neomarinimicrobiota bacterium]